MTACAASLTAAISSAGISIARAGKETRYFVIWTIPGGGHGPDISDAFPGAVLDFFEAHPKP